ncbi:uncharacterized protein LOC123528438 isoform X2 [Mercenaria mercenaria]|uniref:uncharacterized protein LOC123528438 isoform X2 n=1 Tax=Mercenaria mercenaria TaxID=6596 RepID=UPI00234E77F6|nr:uncharacterized protein LOC123528438 isoform X2 [Mercenaria mercenaria]
MEKVLFLILHACVLELVVGRLYLTLASSDCGKSYNMEDIEEEAYVTYNGGWLGKEECTVEFVNYQVYSKQTCIKPVNLTIGCSTKVEYHRYFPSQFADPEKVLTCGATYSDEWCGPLTTQRFYLVFRTSWMDSDDFVKMHLYLKYYPRDDDGDDGGDGDGDDDYNDDTSDQSSSSTIFGIVFPVVCAVVVLLVIIIVFSVIGCKRLQRPSSLRTPDMYRPASGQMDMHTGTGYTTQAQPMVGYQPPQQSQFQPTIQGSYQLHPTQSNLQVPHQQGSSQQTVGRHSPADFQGRFPSPSAPPLIDEDLPPSYESVVK